jgi:PAS domain S-box-containing protein
MSELLDAKQHTTGELNQLAAFSSYLRQHHLEALSVENLRLCRRMDVPLLKLFSHLPEPELVEQGIRGMEMFLQDLEAGRALVAAAQSLKAWEADQIPGVPKHSIQPSDLVLVYAAQKRAIVSFLPRYTRNAEEAVAIACSLEDYYTEVQEGAFQLYARLQEEALMRANMSEAHAEELNALNEELISQTEELQAQQEELNSLYDELKQHSDRVEAEVTSRTQELQAANEELTAQSEELQLQTEELQVQAEELQRQRTLLQDVLDHIPGQVGYCDTDLVIQAVNRSYAANLGLTPANMVGKRARDLFGEHAAEVEQLAHSVLSAGKEWRVNAMPAPVTDEHGTRELFVDSVVCPVPGPDGRPRALISLTTDATERTMLQRELAANIEQVEQQRREQVEQLKAAERHKDEFLNVISHELRTPLNFIMGFASILEDDPGIPDQQRGYVSKILLGADRMLALVEDLLDVARLKAGKVPLAPVPTPYAPLVEEVVATLQPLAAEKHLDVTTEIEVPGLPEIDGPRIVQVLTNLISNAIKFTPEGGTINIRARLDGDTVLTEVEDTGPGIPPADLERIFDPFHQVDMSATREAGGTGLGLSIVRALVEAHHGTIGVRSTLGKGSAFWVRLPA